MMNTDPNMHTLTDIGSNSKGVITDWNGISYNKMTLGPCTSFGAFA